MNLLQQSERCERQLIGYYCVLAQAHPRVSPVRSEHFRNLKLRACWERCRSVDSWVLDDLPLSLDECAALSDEAATRTMVAAVESRLRECWAKLRFAEGLSGILARIQRNGVEDITQLGAEVRELLGTCEAGTLKLGRKMRAVMGDVLREWSSLVKDGKQSDRTIPAPLHQLRVAYTGWGRKHFHVIGGRSSEHKTSFLRQSLWYAAGHGFPACYWTAEDSDVDLGARTLASEVKQFTTGDLLRGTWSGTDTEAAVREAIHVVDSEAARNMIVIDKPAPTKSELIGTLRAVCATGVKIVGIDYLQLVRHDRNGERDADFWRLLTMELHAMAKEMDVAVLATAQIDKIGQRSTNDGTAPKPSDMLYSSSILQDAWAILMVNKPEKNDPLDRRWELNVEKWKDGPKRSYEFLVDAPHDLIIDPQER